MLSRLSGLPTRLLPILAVTLGALSSACRSKPAEVPVSAAEAPVPAVGDLLLGLRFVVATRDGVLARAHVDQIHVAIATANAALRPDGIRVFATRIEAFPMPRLANVLPLKDDLDGDRPTTWLEVEPELRRAFPTTMSVPPNLASRETESNWMRFAGTMLTPPNEMVVWIVERSDGNWGALPWLGRGFTINTGSLADATVFSHELGHALGLQHTFELPTSDAIEPATGRPRSPGSVYDLIYGKASPNGPATFFTSAAQVRAFQGELAPLDDGRCDSAKSGYLVCPGVATRPRLVTGDPALAGLAWQVAESDTPRFGANLMSYLNKGEAGALSRSQTRIARAMLRSDVVISDAWPVMAGRRAGLPQATVPWIHRLPLAADFDGDGRRDVVAYDHANGRFVVATSRSGFQSVETVDAGRPGDVPVIADFDGDGRHDVATFRADIGPQGPASFTICKSASGNGCSAPSVLPLGIRGDVPTAVRQPGRAACPAVFRPTSGTFIAHCGAAASVHEVGGAGWVPLVDAWTDAASDDVVMTAAPGWQTKTLRSGALHATTASGPAFERSPGLAGAEGAVPIRRVVLANGRPGLGWFVPSTGGVWIARSTDEKPSLAATVGSEDRPFGVLLDGDTPTVLLLRAFGAGHGLIVHRGSTERGARTSLGQPEVAEAHVIGDATGDGKPDVLVHPRHASYVFLFASESAWETPTSIRLPVSALAELLLGIPFSGSRPGRAGMAGYIPLP